MIYRRDGLFTPALMGTVIGACTLTQDAFSSLESTTLSAKVDMICLCRSSRLNLCTHPIYFVTPTQCEPITDMRTFEVCLIQLFQPLNRYTPRLLTLFYFQVLS